MPSKPFSNTSILEYAAWLEPFLAAGRISVTVISAFMNWATIWYFSQLPIQLFQGWVYTLIGMMIFTSVAVACTKTTANLLGHLWRFREGNVQGSWSWKHSRLAMIPTVLVVILVSMLLHGGAVVTEVRLIIVWCRWRKAPASSPSKDALSKSVRRLKHSTKEVTSLLALLFGFPSILIKWSLVVLLDDYNLIPVSSCIISALACIVTVATFYALPYWDTPGGPFPDCPNGPSLRPWQRAVGTFFLTCYLLGMFLLRFNTCAWIVMKFGGSATNYFVYMGMITSLVMNLLARHKPGRQEFMQCFRESKVAVVLSTVLASVVMVSEDGMGAGVVVNR
jgi:hypothetical protein